MNIGGAVRIWFWCVGALLLKPRSWWLEEVFDFPWREGFLRPYEGIFETHGHNDFAQTMGIMSPIERIRCPVWFFSALQRILGNVAKLGIIL